MRIVFADGQCELKPRIWYLPALKSGASMWIDNVAILKNTQNTVLFIPLYHRLTFSFFFHLYPSFILYQVCTQQEKGQDM